VAGQAEGEEVVTADGFVARRFPYPGMLRNRLCPCGSKRKFKRCCGTGGVWVVDLTRRANLVAFDMLPDQHPGRYV